MQVAAALADRYAIERELGSGATATVYLARDRKHDRQVALKVLRPELRSVLGAERFLAEIRITAQLHHPHIVTLIDSGETGGFLWYVLPYVRGESLRECLRREGQLSIAETVRITTQVAAALDFAHGQGVVHRDIKPANILLFEGEAMLADFGIALAVREAGADRLTQTGLSLGTPEYMSPEQAIGDRSLDARSDVYSLAAVAYEMLAGEPPITGRNAQAVIAKLVTGRPARVRTLRDTVPPAIDEAIARALAKAPTDRFASAGAFASALDGAIAAHARAPTKQLARRYVATAVATGVVLALATGVWLATRTGDRAYLIPVVERRQITFVGGSFAPALSADGSRVAYAIRRCDPGCRVDLEIQDVDGGAALTVVRNLVSVYRLEWSASGRHLLAVATIGAQYGTYVVSTLGGPPTFFGCCWGTFWPTGDSVIVVRGSFGPDSVVATMATIDGVARDSLRLPPKSWVAVPLHGATLLGIGRVLPDSLALQIVDRRGTTRDSTRFPVGQDGTMGGDDGSMYVVFVGTQGGRAQTFRWRVRPDGRFAAGPDTVALDAWWSSQQATDGRVAYSQGPDERALWALSVEDAVGGRFDPSRRRMQSTAFLRGALSPNGRWILVARPGNRPDTRRVSVVPFDGGTEITVAEGLISHESWTPSGHVVVAETAPANARVVEIQVPSRLRRELGVLEDRAVSEMAVLSDGRLLWVPADRRPVRLGRPSESARSIQLPPWIVSVIDVDPSPDDERAVLVGRNPGLDSVVVATLRIEDGAWTREWSGVAARVGSAKWQRDGSVLVVLHPTQESTELYRLRPGSGMEHIGAIPGPVAGTDLSHDGRLILVTTSQYKGDVWIARLGERR